MSRRNKNPSISAEPVLRSREIGSVSVSRFGNESLVTWKSWILTGNAELGPDAHFTMSGHVADLIHFSAWTISQSCQVWWIEREIHFPLGSRNLATFSGKKNKKTSSIPWWCWWEVWIVHLSAGVVSYRLQCAWVMWFWPGAWPTAGERFMDFVHYSALKL